MVKKIENVRVISLFFLSSNHFHNFSIDETTLHTFRVYIILFLIVFIIKKII